MRKVAAILVVVLAMVHICGLTPFYVAALEKIKVEASLELSITANLVRVVVSPEEMNNPAVFKLHKLGEFCYHGKMHDYKLSEEKDDNHIFYAVQDDNETALIDCLMSFFGNNHDKNTKGPLSKLLKNFSKDYLVNQTAGLGTQAQLGEGFSQPSFNYLSTGFTYRIPYPPDLTA